MKVRRPLREVLEDLGIDSPIWATSTEGVVEIDDAEGSVRVVLPSPLLIDMAKEALGDLHEKLGMGEVFFSVDPGLTAHEEEDQPARRPRVGKFLGVSVPNPAYTFETFLVSSSNRVAYALAKEAASGERGVRGVLYGPSGVGKTHLLYAVAAERISRGYNVLMLTGAGFMDLVSRTAKEGDRIGSVIEDISREADILLMDDIQSLNKPTWQASREALFLLLDAFYRTGRKSILVACDRHPMELENFDERVKRRFYEDPAPIEPPDPLLKTRIFWRTIEEGLGEEAKKISPEDVEEINRIIAIIPPKGVGEVISVAKASLLVASGRPLVPEFVEEAILRAYPHLSGRSVEAMDGELHASAVIQEVARAFLVSPQEIMEKKRQKKRTRVKEAKMVACYLLGKLGFSLRDVGSMTGVSPTSAKTYALEVEEALKEGDPARLVERIGRTVRELRKSNVPLPDDIPIPLEKEDET